MPFNPPVPESRQPRKPSGALGAYVQAEKLMQIALVLPCGVLVGWAIGAWLDGRLHQTWIVLVGIVLGSIAGMVSAIRMALAAGTGSKVENNSGDGTESGKQDKEP